MRDEGNWLCKCDDFNVNAPCVAECASCDVKRPYPAGEGRAWAKRNRPSFFARVKKQLVNAGLFQWKRSYDRKRDRIFTGHVSIGPFTVYGANAMHYAANVRIKGKGYLCARPTTGPRQHWRWYLYLSPDATPGRRVWGFGPGLEHR